MPRRPRVFIEGALYHVYNRTARGLSLLDDEKDAAAFVSLLSKQANRDGWTIFAFCLLNNHYHVVLRSGASPIARGVGRLQARLSQRWNWRRQSGGPLWEGRYKAKLVEDEGYLYQLIAYVHLNPVEAGLVEDPAGWQWSGHLDVIGKSRAPVVDVQAVLSLYGGRLASARQSYVQSLRSQHEGAWIGEKPGRLPWWRAEPDRELEIPVPPAVVDDRGVSSGVYRPQLDPEVFFDLACSVVEADAEELKTASRARRLTRQRQLIVGLGVERWSQSTKSLAALMSRRADIGTLWARRCAELRMEDGEFSSSYESLDVTLSELAAKLVPR